MDKNGKGTLKTIIGPMFSGKCLAKGTNVILVQNGQNYIVPIETLKPGDLLVNEIGQSVPIRTIITNISTYQDPLYHVIYNAGSYGRTSIIATLDHQVYIGQINGVPLDTSLRNVITNIEIYQSIVSMPITNREYYGITLTEGYHFMIVPLLDDNIVKPIPTHNSSLLISNMEKYHIAEYRCVIIKHSTDNRFGGGCCLQTHGGKSYQHIPVFYLSSLLTKESDKIIADYDVIGIDEIQFFSMYDPIMSKATAKRIDEWITKNKIIICAGLDSDWKSDAFGIIAPLIAYSDKVIKLRAVCMRCHAKASFSARSLVDDNIYENPVGGTEKYVALCRKCFHQVNKL